MSENVGTDTKKSFSSIGGENVKRHNHSGKWLCFVFFQFHRKQQQ